MLGLLLSLVLINDIGFTEQENNASEIITSKRNFRAANKIHMKYVDDLTIAEAVKLKKSVNFTPVTDRPQPDSYHARTGHSLKPELSSVFKQIKEVEQYSVKNEMKINQKKTKFLLFNNSKIIDFMPKFTLGNEEINLVEELKVLGVVLSSDLKWNSHTDHIITSAFKKIWMLRRLKSLGTALPELKDIYIQHVRSILEFAVPVWHSGLTQCNRSDIERVQKSAMHIILGDSYTTYENALRTMDLETLESRRSRLCSKFAIKSLNETP